jgi:hypothetical protein
MVLQYNCLALWRKVKSTQTQLMSLSSHNEDLKNLIFGSGFGNKHFKEWDMLKNEVIVLRETLDSMGALNK